MVGVHSGTTTVVDQGGPSCMTLPGFRKFVAEPATTRIYAFLSAYLVGGLEGHYYPALYGPDGVDVPATIRAAQENADLVRGIKAHAEIGGVARWGLEVLRLGRRDRPRGRAPPLRPLRPALAAAQVGGGRRGSGRDPPARGRDPPPRGRPRASVHSPSRRLRRPRRGTCTRSSARRIARGLRIDVGHGSHFSFDVARRVLDAGIVPDTLGADLHGYNTEVPRPAGTPPGRPPGPRAPPLRREHALQPGPRDDGPHGVRALAGAGRADGDPERRAHARAGGRAGHASPRHGRRRHGARRPARAASPSGTTAAPR